MESDWITAILSIISTVVETAAAALPESTAAVAAGTGAGAAGEGAAAAGAAGLTSAAGATDAAATSAALSDAAAAAGAGGGGTGAGGAGAAGAGAAGAGGGAGGSGGFLSTLGDLANAVQPYTSGASTAANAGKDISQGNWAGLGETLGGAAIGPITKSLGSYLNPAVSPTGDALTGTGKEIAAQSEKADLAQQSADAAKAANANPAFPSGAFNDAPQQDPLTEISGTHGQRTGINVAKVMAPDKVDVGGQIGQQSGLQTGPPAGQQVLQTGGTMADAKTAAKGASVLSASQDTAAALGPDIAAGLTPNFNDVLSGGSSAPGFGDVTGGMSSVPGFGDVSGGASSTNPASMMQKLGQYLQPARDFLQPAQPYLKAGAGVAKGAGQVGQLMNIMSPTGAKLPAIAPPPARRQTANINPFSNQMGMGQYGFSPFPIQPPAILGGVAPLRLSGL